MMSSKEWLQSSVKEGRPGADLLHSAAGAAAVAVAAVDEHRVATIDISVATVDSHTAATAAGRAGHSWKAAFE